MPKRGLRQPIATLEHEAITTMMAGCRQWRLGYGEDNSYPESYSDFEACFRALWQMFDIERRPLPRSLDGEYEP